MTEITYTVVPSTKAQRIADDLKSEFRYYTGELIEIEKATKREVENVTKGFQIDSDWIMDHAKKAAKHQSRIETLIEIARYVDLTKEQIALALSDARVWFQTPEEAAEMAEADAKRKG